MHKIVLLYNDRDRPMVKAIYVELDKRFAGTGVVPWMASENMTAFDDIFNQIEDAIREGAGAVVFLGQYGLGRFQRNIEIGAVSSEIWQRGSTYGRLLVHLAPSLDVPPALLRWPTVNHDGALADASELSIGIAQRFGFVTSPSHP